MLVGVPDFLGPLETRVLPLPLNQGCHILLLGARLGPLGLLQLEPDLALDLGIPELSRLVCPPPGFLQELVLLVAPPCVLLCPLPGVFQDPFLSLGRGPLVAIWATRLPVIPGPCARWRGALAPVGRGGGA